MVWLCESVAKERLARVNHGHDDLKLIYEYCGLHVDADEENLSNFSMSIELIDAITYEIWSKLKGLMIERQLWILLVQCTFLTFSLEIHRLWSLIFENAMFAAS